MGIAAYFLQQLFSFSARWLRTVTSRKEVNGPSLSASDLCRNISCLDLTANPGKLGAVFS